MSTVRFSRLASLLPTLNCLPVSLCPRTYQFRGILNRSWWRFIVREQYSIFNFKNIQYPINTLFGMIVTHRILKLVYSTNIWLTFQSLLVTWCTTSLTFNNCTLCPHCIYVFCVYLRTNSDLCRLQHKLIGFYSRDEKCLQRGTDWVFK